MASSNFPLPLLFINLGSSNPYDAAKYLRDLADVIETQADAGEKITYHYRGNSADACGGETKIKWSHTSEDERKFVQFKVSGEPKPYGEIREVCGMTFSTEQIRTLPTE